jgi:hypothetical protein
MSSDPSSPETKPIVGWVEYVALPAWGIRRLRAKMDTGAKTSALHVENVVELGNDLVGFDVVRNRGTRSTVHVETKIRRRGRVRSSNGHYTTRIFVATLLEFAGMQRLVEFSLVDRNSMIHRVLLGRTALKEVLVDVTGHHRQRKLQRPKRERSSGLFQTQKRPKLPKVLRPHRPKDPS